MNILKPREIAVRILQQHAEGSDYIELLLDKTLATQDIPPLDRRLVQELVYGAVRWKATLDWLVARKTDARPQPVLLQILLRLGLYQMFWLERIPNHATVHETVELAKQFGFGHQAGFVNALLRGYTREQEATRLSLASLRQSEPAIAYSLPDWLAQRWIRRWGAQNAALLMEWNNTPPKTFARINRLKTDPLTLANAWEKEGVRFIPRTYPWIEPETVFELDGGPAPSSLATFRQGLFYIQDPSTLLAIQELDPRPAETILDMCAAPGGKTAHAAERMNNTGTIIAQDLYPQRLTMVEDNCRRLGISSVNCVRPSDILFPELTAQFDRVLLDAPCSNSGVMRRRVDLRWRIRPEEIQRLAANQLRLLHQATLQLRPGGTLVYSTCSLEPEENLETLQKFLATHPEFQLVSERDLLPFRDSTDGAYVASLIKKENP